MACNRNVEYSNNTNCGGNHRNWDKVVYETRNTAQYCGAGWLEAIQTAARNRCCQERGTGFNMDNNEQQQLIRWLIFILIILLRQEND